jgi:hypothetical protein
MLQLKKPLQIVMLRITQEPRISAVRREAVEEVLALVNDPWFWNGLEVAFVIL